MDADLQENLRRITASRPEPGALSAPPTPTPKLKAVGIGRPTANASGTAGIASPLTEPDYTTRTWHTAQTLTSTDGIWAIQVQHVATIDMVDDNGLAVQFSYDGP